MVALPTLYNTQCVAQTQENPHTACVCVCEREEERETETEREIEKERERPWGDYLPLSAWWETREDIPAGEPHSHTEMNYSAIQSIVISDHKQMNIERPCKVIILNMAFLCLFVFRSIVPLSHSACFYIGVIKLFTILSNTHIRWNKL